MGASRGMVALALLAGAGVGFGIGMFCLRGERTPAPALAIPTEGLSVEIKQLGQEMARLREQTARLEQRLPAAPKQAAPAQPEPTYQGKPLSHWLMLLNDAEQKTRDQGAEAIDQIGPRAQAALPILIRLMMEEGVRSLEVANALVSVDRTHELLRTRLKDKDYRTRRNAALILGMIDTPAWPGRYGSRSGYSYASSQPSYLEEDYWKEEQKTRRAAEDRVAIPVLIEALNDRQNIPPSTTSYRERALWALQSFGPEARAAVPALCSLMADRDHTIRSVAAETLGSIGPEAKEAIPLLLTALRDPERWMRRCAALGLGGIGVSTPQVLAALKAALKDKEEWVRAAAAEAMVGMKGTASELVGALQEAMRKDPVEEVKVKAMRTLALFGSAARPAVPALVQMMEKDANRTMRCAAYRALEKIAPEEAKCRRSPFEPAAPATPSLPGPAAPSLPAR